MTDLEKVRTDVTDSFEDFERLMEDYFAVIPPDIERFKVAKTTHWEYDDLENSMTFYFADDWDQLEFIDELKECPGTNLLFDFHEHEHADLENLTVKIIGREGGLM